MLCAGAAKLVYELLIRLLPGKAAVLAAIAAAVPVYAVFLVWLHALGREDLQMLPGGEKVVKLLEKRGWMR